MENDTVLEECPFCKGNETRLEFFKGKCNWTAQRYKVCVVCDKCKACGPYVTVEIPNSVYYEENINEKDQVYADRAYSLWNNRG